MSDNREGTNPKVGAGHLQAMGRQGLHELRNALYPASNVAAPSDAGAYGVALPSEIAAQRHEDLQPGEAPATSIIDSRIKAADRQVNLSPAEHSRTEPMLERE